MSDMEVTEEQQAVEKESEETPANGSNEPHHSPDDAPNENGQSKENIPQADSNSVRSK